MLPSDRSRATAPTAARAIALPVASEPGPRRTSEIARTYSRFENACSALARRSARSVSAMALRLIETPTNRSPSSAADAPASARKTLLQLAIAAAKAAASIPAAYSGSGGLEGDGRRETGELGEGLRPDRDSARGGVVDGHGRQAGLEQDGDVVLERGPGHSKLAGEVARRAGTRLELAQDVDPDRIAE